MITDEQYAKKSIEFLNELKSSITKEEKQHLRKKINNPKFEDFFEDNFDEIIKFIESSPSQRLKIKKWKENFDLFVFYSYVILLNNLNNHLIPKINFYPNLSYRSDLAKLCKLSVLCTNKIEADFFSCELHCSTKIYTSTVFL